VNGKHGTWGKLRWMATFGGALQDLFSSRGWSLREAGSRLGVSASLLGMITAGRRRPPLDRLDHWRAALGLDQDAFARLFELALHAHGCPALARLVKTLSEDSASYQRRRAPARVRLRVAEDDQRGRDAGAP
jgi:transcriptional regulator with XRE-family HTH domain